MSEKSSTKKHIHRVIETHIIKRSKDSSYNWRMLGLLPAWVTAAYAASYFVVVALLEIARIAGLPLSGFLRPSIIQAVAATLMYILTITIIIVTPYLLRGSFSTSLKTLGLGRLMSWTDIGLSPVFYVVYMMTMAGVMVLIASLFPFLPLDQTQDIGFNTLGSSTDNIVAFVVLVVFAPVAEETLFRGYLYGKLKGYVPAIVAALVTSLLFGIAHMQLNVGIDVFILSLFLCALRSLTGSIWAGILVHMIKNGVAYFILFVLPFIGG